MTIAPCIRAGTLAALILSAPLAAQEPARPDTTKPGMMMSGSRCPMMRDMMEGGMRGDMVTSPEGTPAGSRALAFSPGELLSHKENLALTSQQESRLTALRVAAESANQAALEEEKKHTEALGQTVAAPVIDTSAARLHLLGAGAARDKAQWALLRAAAQAKAVLTEAQRGRVEGWIDERDRARERRKGAGSGMGMMDMMGMMGMMKDCPMMGGGMHGDASK